VIVLALINTLILLAIATLGSDSSTVLFLCNGIAAGCGAAVLYMFGKGTLQMRLTLLLAAGLLIGYCGGTVSAQLTQGLAGHDAIASMGIDRHYIVYATMLVLLSCACLLTAGYFEPPLVPKGAVFEVSWKQERFLWIALVFVAAAYLHGDLSFGGIQGPAASGKISVLDSIIASVVPLMAPIATIGIVQSTGMRRIRFIVLALLSLLACLPVSRRTIFYVLLVSVFAGLQLSGRRLQISGSRKLLLGAGLVGAVIISNLFVLGTRMTRNATGDAGEHLSLAGVLRVAARTTFTNPQLIFRELHSNVGSRTLVIHYLALLSRGGDARSPMLGRDALFAVQASTPDFVYSLLGEDKTDIRKIGAEEGLADEHFGIPSDIDQPNSILSAGIIDFGLAGALIYPVILCAFFRLLFLVMAPFINREGQLIVIISLLYVFVQLETGLSGYPLTIRSLAILLILWGAIYSLPRIAVGHRRDVQVPVEL